MANLVGGNFYTGLMLLLGADYSFIAADVECWSFPPT